MMWVSATDIHQSSQTSYTALCNGVVSHGAEFGGLQVFAATSHAKLTQNKCVHDLRAIRHFAFVCLHAQIAVHAGIKGT